MLLILISHFVEPINPCRITYIIYNVGLKSVYLISHLPEEDININYREFTHGDNEKSAMIFHPRLLLFICYLKNSINPC